MANSARLTLTQLRDQIKVESRVKGADNLDPFINDVVNELLLDYAQKNRYFEFLVTNAPLTTLLATSDYDLPDDYMNIRLVRFRRASGYTSTLRPRSAFVDTAAGRLPRYYEIVGDQIQVFPYEDLPADDTILLDYFKIPETLTDEDPFPIPRLQPTIKRDAIHRVLLFNRDLQVAAAHKGDAMQSETRTKPADG